VSGFSPLRWLRLESSRFSRSLSRSSDVFMSPLEKMADAA
jgi:hypothetical protein